MRHIKAIIFYILMTALIVLAATCGGCAQTQIKVVDPQYNLTIDEDELDLEVVAGVEVNGRAGSWFNILGLDRAFEAALTIDLSTGELCGSFVVFGFEVDVFEPCDEEESE